MTPRFSGMRPLEWGLPLPPLEPAPFTGPIWETVEIEGPERLHVRCVGGMCSSLCKDFVKALW